MWVHCGLCEEEKVAGVLVHHRNDVEQGGIGGPCPLRIDGEEPEPYGRREGVWSMPGFVSRSARDAVGRSERSKVEVTPSGLV